MKLSDDDYRILFTCKNLPINWTLETLSSHLILEVDSLEKSFNRLLKYDLIDKNWFVTLKGIEVTYDALNVPFNSYNLIEWKEEVSSGLRSKRSSKSGYLVTEKSKLQRPVVPSQESYGNNNTKTPEDELADLEYIIAIRSTISNEFGISIEDLERFSSEGRIKMCTNGKPHLGVFHWKNKGKRLQQYCIKCSKMRKKWTEKKK